MKAYCVDYPFLDSVIMGSATNFLYQKLVLLLRILWVSLSTHFLPPLCFFFRAYLFRLKRNDSSSNGNANQSGISSEEKSRKVSNPIEPKPELEPKMDTVREEAKQDSVDFTDGISKKETPEFSFKFKFPTYEEFSQSKREEIGDSISFETEVVSFHPKEVSTDTNGGPFDDKDSVNAGFSLREFLQIDPEEKPIEEEVPEESTSRLCTDDVPEKTEAMAFTKEEEQPVDSGKSEQPVDSGKSLLSDEFQEKDSLAMDSDSETFSSSPLRSAMSRLMDSYSDGFLSDGDFGGEMSDFDETHLDDSSKEDEEGETHSMEELKKLEEAHVRNAGESNSDFLSEKDFPVKIEDCGKVKSKNASDWDSEDSNKLETLWEHQELIEQLKMELKKVRATGLPTILEESDESPKIMEDLKPWKIEDKFQRVDRMDELHKFYKSYRERMRKFDILNYQKMYAIGFLQLKEPLQSIPSEKSSVPLDLSQVFSLCNRKKVGNDPMMKFIVELQSDLEVVYVGQMCLSWEILHWQYGKALELWESDHRGIRQYNEVAGEFQQFQVLVQRFVEDGPFQGPRVQNYVKSRCVLRNLLQVPVIREDSKDRKKAMKRRERGDYAITSDMLIEIIEESIRIFWRFVRADKDSSSVIVKCRKGPHVELQNPEDSDLLEEVRANLQKKERKLRDLLRSGNCILRMFRKSTEEDGSDHVLYFFSQVDMKLVARVLNMSRITTDQLHWCRNKLTKISFVNRKIRVEPSFSLFPC